MSALQDAMRAAAERGDTAFTVWSAPGGWQCNVRHANGGWTCVVHADPVAGLLGVLAADRAPVAPEKPAAPGNQDIFS